MILIYVRSLEGVGGGKEGQSSLASLSTHNMAVTALIIVWLFLPVNGLGLGYGQDSKHESSGYYCQD